MTALTRDDMIGIAQKEVAILRHLAGKIDRSQLDYRPAPKQRSTIELLRYLTIMGPGLVKAIKAGKFDVEAWQAESAKANASDFDQVLTAIEQQSAQYAALLSEYTDEDFAGQVALFGPPASRGRLITELVLGGCAAYRTQLFLYLKACGREELSTYNLWQGIDAPPAAAV